MSEALTAFLTILLGSITQVATAIGSGLTALVKAIFFTTSGSSSVLSDFGGIVALFAGISLALGLAYWVVNFIRSFGN